jgi:hypothetical protein
MLLGHFRWLFCTTTPTLAPIAISVGSPLRRCLLDAVSDATALPNSMPRTWNPQLMHNGRTTQEWYFAAGLLAPLLLPLLTLYSYDLPHRVRFAKVYPVQDQLGSTALIYAHESGLSVLWKGGPSLKDRETSEALPLPVNGTLHTGNGHSGSKAQYSEEEEIAQLVDEPIVFHLDIHTGSTVLDFSFPVIHSHTGFGDSTPPILNDFIIAVAACADAKVRVVRIPLAPERVVAPNDVWDKVAIAEIAPSGVPTCVAATWTPSLHSFDESGFDNVDAEGSSLPAGSIPIQFDLLVAICTTDGGGTLSITRVPLEHHGGIFFPYQHQ